ncbi:Uncharacterised protein [Pseudomonas luteola]|uniref:Uncharacterized protein n=1 Tax=Pseudomonas luteola TaxID=47886 RepID=A0A2X2DZB8_PSELU|nr:MULTISPECIES: hypothetical protein [Pseudomonas]MBA1250203.1 hypothetical protein [Pseudomonas zeshuii]MBH3440954.1 hypothetical protein [Pseudomonas luteola]SPY99940.1 Uncharacterised protein [Pseudomonas luteola]
MRDLSLYLESQHKSITMVSQGLKWPEDRDIPSSPGWYYISTDTPIHVLQRQKPVQKQYTRKRTQQRAGVRNYDIGARAKRYTEDLSEYYSKIAVYSGMASNLSSRAREHLCADPGTASLAIANFPELLKYEWYFHFVTLKDFMDNCQNSSLLLRLGEQQWRAKYGWPLLSSA